jgi:hypothetical protein
MARVPHRPLDAPALGLVFLSMNGGMFGSGHAPVHAGGRA